MKYECFMFDLDGTILDSNYAHENAYLKSLEFYKIDATSFCYKNYFGWKTKDVYRDFGIRDNDLIEKLVLQKRLYYSESLAAGHVTLFDGVRELMRALREHNKEVGLVTGAALSTVDAVFRRYKLQFEFVIHGDMATRGKPYPDLYNYAVNTTRFSLHDCVAIEDSYQGFLAANQASLDCILINQSVNAGVRQFPTIKDFYNNLDLFL